MQPCKLVVRFYFRFHQSASFAVFHWGVWCVPYQQQDVDMHSTHFRYGTIQWTNGANSWAFTIRANIAFRYSYFKQVYGVNPVVGDTFTYDTLLVGYTYDDWLFGDSYYEEKYYADFTIDHIDPGADWLTAYLFETYTYPSDCIPSYGSKIGYYGGDRLVNLNNNAEGMWLVWMSVPFGLSTTKYSSSPVSGMLPIVPAYFGKVNSIPVLASHNQSPTKLKYTMSTWSGMTQPPQMSVDANSGIITYNPTALGLWSTQIVVCETLGVISCTTIDFLINVTKPIVTPDLPPYFVTPPTPAVNSYVDFTTGIASSFQLKGVSPQATSTVSISTAAFPMAGLKDSKGLQLAGGVYNFFLRVTTSVCGNGQQLPDGTCICDAGWVGTQCNQCAPGNYGPTCLPLPPCVNGQSNGGPYGDGKCVCSPGWQGAACNISSSARCSDTAPSAIITQTSSGSSSVSPDYVQASLAVSATALQVPLALLNKFTIPAEVFIIYDLSTTAANNARYKQFISSFTNFKSYFATKRETVNFGLGTFSDSATQSNTFQLAANFMPDIGPTLNSLTLLTGNPSANIPYNVLIDAIPKIGFSNSGTMKMIYLVTDNNIAPTDNTLITNLVNALNNRNILLGVFALDSVSSYAPLFAAAGAGSAYAWPATSATPWFNLFIDNIYTPMITNIVVKVRSDLTGLVSIPPPSPSTTTTWYTTLLLPTPAPTTLSPQVQINVVGFDRQTIAVAINHAPTTASVQFTNTEDTSYPFAIVGADIDQNPLTIALTQLPALGSIQINGVTMVLNTQYTLPSSSTNAFKFVPNANANGNDVALFAVSDGCLAANGQITIQITPSNDPPTCQAALVSTDQNTAKPFTLAVTDVDSTGLTVEFSSSSVIQTLGSITTGGSAIVDGTKYPSGSSFTFTPFLSANGSATFPFVVRDELMSSQCSVTVQVVRVNVAPTLSVQSPINMIPDSTQYIPFTVTDPDNYETLTVTITAANPVGGAFFGPQGEALTGPFPMVIGAYDVSLTHSAMNNLSYHSANNQDTGVSITISVSDTSNAVDAETVLILITGNRTNSAPSATPVGPIVLDQDTLSSTFLLNGTDPDQTKYDNILDIVISSYPSKGVLETPTGTALVTPLKTALSVVYAPNPGWFGDDQLTFYVVDSLGVASSPQTVLITVNHVNHAPVISASDVFATGQQGQWLDAPITISASDIDNDVLTVSVTALPSSGSIKNSDGLVISTVPTAISNLSITYSPSSTVYYNFIQQYTVQVCDDDTPSLCSSASANIHYTYTNSAPTGEDNKVTTSQDVPVNFTLAGTDFEDGSNVLFTIVLLPSDGRLYTQDGLLIDSTTQTFTNPNLHYVPAEGVSNMDTPGQQGPVESFYYSVIDQNGTLSLNYNIQVFIIPFRPPTYHGDTNFTTLEDNSLSISLNAISQYGDPKFFIEFMSATAVGNLTYTSCPNDGTCSQAPLVQGVRFIGPPFTVDYSPAADAFGPQLATFSFRFIDSNTSEVITATVDVVPVNDPPYIQPITISTDLGTIQMGSLLSMPMNSTALLVFNASDIDSPYSSLLARLRTQAKGSMLSYDGQPTPTNNSVVINKGDIIPRSADGLWRMFYQPTPGRNGIGYDAISFAVYDDKELISPSYSLRVNVNPINLAPVVSVNQTHWNLNAKTTSTNIIGITVDDPDSLYNNISFTLALAPEGSIELPYSKNSPNCDFSTPSNVTCTAPKGTLNTFLTMIRLNFTLTEDANYTLTVTVSDLGYMGGNVLTDQKTVDVSILPSAISKTKNNTVVLAASISAAAVAAALIALGVWRLIKSKAPPTDAFFGDSPFADSNVSSNPLYQDSGRSGVNPLYQDIN
ncbi:substrate adhesion molecule [Cavenderia fasciculata]|uniref:Substrate adhesion molecule n=1 Tax=Cavenderia fasciculata TaxID=261658 RepID=F4Q501_CACFS|nr:substrate adhesion molecule [Cavenderia fasciculata]EGG17107.1 substrate adhesion molecule [Cavenderia fasciculata]|eukprot:XP_004355591.1 substrate adhesion molecule [Cavenderia fasciculata]